MAEGMYKLFGDLKVEVRQSEATDEVELIFYRSTPDTTEIMTPGEFGWDVQSFPRGSMMNLKEMNHLRMSRHMAQALADALFKRFTPMKPKATEAELGAVKHHLADARDLLEQVLPHALRGKDGT